MVILIYNALGKMKSQGMKITDLAASLTNIEQAVLALAPDNFGQYGVEINKVSGLTISLPDEVQKAIDTRSQMQVLGVNYMQYQAGQAMIDAASNPSGTAGIGAGLGVGIGAGAGMGYAFGGQMAQGMMGGGQQTRSCPNCGSIIAATAPSVPTAAPPCSRRLPEGSDSDLRPVRHSAARRARSSAPTAARRWRSRQPAPQAAQKTCPNCGAAISGNPKFCPQCGKAALEVIVR